MNNIEILDRREILDQDVTTYGDLENPLYLAKDVAIWIGYEISNVSKMVKNVEEDEKVIARINNTSAIFLTEDGLYEVLMQSRKPIAREFKKKVKKLLKDLRLNRFNSYENLSKELQAIIVLDRKQQEAFKKIETVETNLEDFKNNAPLFNSECDELMKAVKKSATRVLGGYKSKAYNDKSLRAKVYSDIQQQIRRQFGVASYKAIKRVQLHKALDIVEGYEAPLVLEEVVDVVNNQLAMA